MEKEETKMSLSAIASNKREEQEKNVLNGLLLGMSMYQIAAILKLKQETVKNIIRILQERGSITIEEIETRKNDRFQIVATVSREKDFAQVREKIDLPEQEIERMIRSVQEGRIISNKQIEMEVAKERETNQTTKQKDEKQPLQITRQELKKIEKELNSRSRWSLQGTKNLINVCIKAGYYVDAIKYINIAFKELPMEQKTRIKFEEMKESLNLAMKKQKLQETLASQNYPHDSSSLSQRLGIPETEVIRLQRELENNTSHDELEL